ncbi:uncharacterized protein MONOS_5040 [Monocercomonoides exilis]|uniref:uncharacterized protein n=1 Tax=Monocercomonoides exilis TaxID=2049356 RepID=UPI00355987A0|nr:hypothetical protein MONOS_5040 [Monocercomonoides exilis]|eukprot:MONOS_5040.1-p1 / transcript=MONOS_5040.1 / gene=MONOS_5040 / organism=Monocercomonoides_exilis_PA203 / gene_product=unspecified product / transcript_product=unspecified product / location=Mono_scaffold00142:71322-74511(+) / protein_length=969 / sequence_SO=supercontig / SO=protein_coding / is_pseudo=false
MQKERLENIRAKIGCSHFNVCDHVCAIDEVFLGRLISTRTSLGKIENEYLLNDQGKIIHSMYHCGLNYDVISEDDWFFLQKEVGGGPKIVGRIVEKYGKRTVDTDLIAFDIRVRHSELLDNEVLELYHSEDESFFTVLLSSFYTREDLAYEIVRAIGAKRGQFIRFCTSWEPFSVAHFSTYSEFDSLFNSCNSVLIEILTEGESQPLAGEMGIESVCDILDMKKQLDFIRNRRWNKLSDASKDEEVAEPFTKSKNWDEPIFRDEQYRHASQSTTFSSSQPEKDFGDSSSGPFLSQSLTEMYHSALVSSHLSEAKQPNLPEPGPVGLKSAIGQPSPYLWSDSKESFLGSYQKAATEHWIKSMLSQQKLQKEEVSQNSSLSEQKQTGNPKPSQQVTNVAEKTFAQSPIKKEEDSTPGLKIGLDIFNNIEAVVKQILTGLSFGSVRSLTEFVCALLVKFRECFELSYMCSYLDALCCILGASEFCMLMQVCAGSSFASAVFGPAGEEAKPKGNGMLQSEEGKRESIGRFTEPISWTSVEVLPVFELLSCALQIIEGKESQFDEENQPENAIWDRLLRRECIILLCCAVNSILKQHPPFQIEMLKSGFFEMLLKAEKNWIDNLDQFEWRSIVEEHGLPYRAFYFGIESKKLLPLHSAELSLLHSVCVSIPHILGSGVYFPAELAELLIMLCARTTSAEDAVSILEMMHVLSKHFPNNMLPFVEHGEMDPKEHVHPLYKTFAEKGGIFVLFQLLQSSSFSLAQEEKEKQFQSEFIHFPVEETHWRLAAKVVANLFAFSVFPGDNPTSQHATLLYNIFIDALSLPEEAEKSSVQFNESSSTSPNSSLPSPNPPLSSIQSQMPEEGERDLNEEDICEKISMCTELRFLLCRPENHEKFIKDELLSKLCILCRSVRVELAVASMAVLCSISKSNNKASLDMLLNHLHQDDIQSLLRRGGLIAAYAEVLQQRLKEIV